MRIKTLLLTTSILACLAPALAQSVEVTDDVPEKREARIEFGVRAGGFVAMARSDGYYAMNNLHGVSGGAIARLRSGVHHRFGLELSASHAASERSFTEVQDWWGHGMGTTAGFRKHSTDVGVQFQLHPGRDGQAVRPYVGGGMGVVWNRFATENQTLDNYLNTGFQIGGPLVEPMLQLEQGLMWQVSDQWYFSQSLHYRYDMDYGGSTVSVRFGLFYGL